MDDEVEQWRSLLGIEEFTVTEIDTPLDTNFQREIHMDSLRTRSSQMSRSEQHRLEVLMTYYCKDQRIAYKQGMNELLAPFIILCRSGLPDGVAYSLFEGFIKKVYPTMFVDEAYRPILGFFEAFRLLSAYHYPEISLFLEERNLTPMELTTHWFITLFAAKVEDVKLLWLLWQEILKENDILFPCFIAVSLMASVKSYFLLEDLDNFKAAEIFMNIKILSESNLKRILQAARKLKENMPYSSIIRLKKYNIFNLSMIESMVRSLKKDQCLNVLAREILQRTYPSEKFCNCVVRTCQWCEKTDRLVPLILLDCRPSSEQRVGMISNSGIIDPQVHQNPSLIEEIPDQYMDMRDTFHIALMGSGHKEKIVNKLASAFLKKGFKYISVVEGGYESCHEFIFQYDLPMSIHNVKLCKLCKPSKISVMTMIKGKIKKSIKTPRHNSVNNLLSENFKAEFSCWKYDNDFGSILYEEIVQIFPDKVVFKNLKEYNECLLSHINSIVRHKDSNLILVFSIRTNSRKKYYKFQTEEDATDCLNLIIELLNDC